MYAVKKTNLPHSKQQNPGQLAHMQRLACITAVCHINIRMREKTLTRLPEYTGSAGFLLVLFNALHAG